MKVRILTAIGMAIFGIPLLIFSDMLIYPIAVSALALIAMFEMLGVTGFRRNPAVFIPAYAAVAAFPLLSYFFAENLKELAVAALLTTMGLLLYYFGYAVTRKGRVKFSSLATHITTLFYLAASFSSISLVRYIPNGVYYFGMVFLASWTSDVFAYFCGRAFGKHKLIPEVSPKKTVEGAIGGVIFTTLAFLLYGFIITMLEGTPNPNYIVLALLGFVLSIVSMFGDLIASLIKREHGIKDYGKIFPGHGGVLDRFDSILAVAPILLALCIFFPPFS